MNAWNWIGIIAWAVVVLGLIGVIRHIRHRRLKALVTANHVSGKVVTQNVAELAVVLLALLFMVWVTWGRTVANNDHTQVTAATSYQRLVLQADQTGAFYVAAKAGNGKRPTRYYTYWAPGKEVSITSRNADIASDVRPLTERAAAYPWTTKKLTQMDAQNERAFVATFVSTYKPTVMNALGMHVGKEADRFDLIRIPNKTFLKIVPMGDK